MVCVESEVTLVVVTYNMYHVSLDWKSTQDSITDIGFIVASVSARNSHPNGADNWFTVVAMFT